MLWLGCDRKLALMRRRDGAEPHHTAHHERLQQLNLQCGGTHHLQAGVAAETGCGPRWSDRAQLHAPPEQPQAGSADEQWAWCAVGGRVTMLPAVAAAVERVLEAGLAVPALSRWGLRPQACNLPAFTLKSWLETLKHAAPSQLIIVAHQAMPVNHMLCGSNWKAHDIANTAGSSSCS